MQVRVHYQNLDNSPWMAQFIESRVGRLDKYLDPSSSVQVNVRQAKRGYVTSVAIHNPHHDYAFMGEGMNLFESFSEAIDKAARVLGEHKNRIKDKIHKKFNRAKFEEAP